jgi:hypothetical protein
MSLGFPPLEEHVFDLGLHDKRMNNGSKSAFLQNNIALQ